jgi:hypothetical protein
VTRRRNASCAWALSGRRAGSRTLCGLPAEPKRAILDHPYCQRHLDMVLARFTAQLEPPLSITGMSEIWRGTGRPQRATRDLCQECWEAANPGQYSPLATRYDTCQHCGAITLVARSAATPAVAPR